MKKSRFCMIHPETNQGKIEQLEALQQEYVAYVRICVQTMLDSHCFNMPKSDMQKIFPKAQFLTSQIQKNVRSHAIQIVSSWAKSIYPKKMKSVISKLKRAETITDAKAKALYTVGKYCVSQPTQKNSQEDIDLYWKLLEEHGGKKPHVSDNLPMKLSMDTARLEDPEETILADFWLRVSSLEYRKSVWLPLVGNPYILNANEVSKGMLLRKDKKGRWRGEAVETKEWFVPEPKIDAPKLGVDVGLNVLAATSDGTLYGKEVKPQFDKIYALVQNVRANRQRQGFKENSPRLDCLESRLSGLIKTETGTIANKLVKRFPDTVFVIEDLDLSGCRGSKRFAYRALQKALETKANVLKVNPAYTSQECPSCGYISKKNRHGVKFVCICCGRRSHADWVGSQNILRRSEDKNILADDHPSVVKRELLERFQRKWVIGSVGPVEGDMPSWHVRSPLPLGRRLTTDGSFKDVGIASNLVSQV